MLSLLDIELDQRISRCDLIMIIIKLLAELDLEKKLCIVLIKEIYFLSF